MGPFKKNKGLGGHFQGDSTNRFGLYPYLCKAFQSILRSIRIECRGYVLKTHLFVYYVQYKHMYMYYNMTLIVVHEMHGQIHSN